MEKIIHQMWFQGPELVPDQYRISSKSWQHQNPGYDYMFWDENEIDNLLVQKYPEYVSKWRGLDKLIKKCDAARYFILHSYGGVYADLDTTAYRGMDQLIDDLNLSEFDIVFSEESHDPICWKRELLKRVAQEMKTETVVGNAILISRRNREFWLGFLKEAFEKRDAPVLEAFSTWHLTKHLSLGAQRDRIKILPSQYLLSMHFQEGVSYAVHRYEATWFDHSKSKPWEG